MIVRILNEGQFDLGDDDIAEFNRLDDELVKHVERGDEPAFQRDLTAMADLVRTEGTELPDDDLRPSDLVLPNPHATLEEVRALLSEEGLVPD